MTAATAIEKAKKLGNASADAYRNEFGVSPKDDGQAKVGDWDSAAWQLHWNELKDDGLTDDDYTECLAAWREGFWGKVDRQYPLPAVTLGDFEPERLWFKSHGHPAGNEIDLYTATDFDGSEHEIDPWDRAQILDPWSEFEGVVSEDGKTWEWMGEEDAYDEKSNTITLMRAYKD